jgi:maleate isomerase
MHVGLIIPSSNTVMERELSTYVTVHSTRVSLKKVDEISLKKMNEDLLKALDLITDCNPDVIIYGCTSGSFIENVEKIFKKSSVPVITTSQAVISALRTLKAEKISVATPYSDKITQKETEFLESEGFEIEDTKGLGLVDNAEIGRQKEYVAYKLAQSLRKADVVFISCTNFNTFSIIEKLENELKIPVISSNSASLWSALKVAEKKYTIHLGRLLGEFL